MNTGDTAWVLMSTGLVMLMTPGLAFFYGGMVRRKNVLGVLMQCFTVLCVLSLQWVLFGYSLSFAPSKGFFGSLAWVGLNGVGLEPYKEYAATIPHQAFMIFQGMFAIITPALIIGAFAERMKFSAFLLFTVLWATLVYDPVAHWVWGSGGWLKDLGALDFAGGTVVHINAGIAALATAVFIGRRKGYNHKPVPPHNLPHTVLGTAISLVLTVCAAYPLSRKELVGRRFFNGLFLFTMLFSGGMIPTYLVVKDLGLRNTIWAMVIPSAFSVWNMIVTRTYFQTTIPDELYEAAQLDGCSDFRFLRSVVIPLSGPILAVIGLYYAVGQWNSYFNALLYIDTPKLYPLQLVLRDILVLNNTDMTMMQDVNEMIRKLGLANQLKYAVIVVASVPVMLVYPFVQRYFIKGTMVGAIKG